MKKLAKKGHSLNITNFKRGMVENHVKKLITDYNTLNPLHQHPMVVVSHPGFVIFEGIYWCVPLLF